MRFFPVSVVVAGGREAMSDGDIINLLNQYLQAARSTFRLQPLTPEQFVIAPSTPNPARRAKKAKKR